MRPTLSVVVPVYGCPDSLVPLTQRVFTVAASLDLQCEIVLVDDDCPQDSWSVIRRLTLTDTRIRGIRLSRNFGQHSAIEAGLSHSAGDWVVVMDCDLQDRPEEIAQLYARAVEGDVDIVLARRTVRRDAAYRRAVSGAFYSMLSFLTGQPLDPSVANFGIYHRRVVDAYCSWEEYQKFFPVMIQWLGFEKAAIEVQHDSRQGGGSSYTLKKLMTLGFDVIFSFSDRPLWITALAGLTVAGLALVTAIVFTLMAVFGEIAVQGWASLMISVWLLSGVILAGIGLTGIYVGRVLRDTKDRPAFIVADALGRGLDNEAIDSGSSSGTSRATG